MAWIPMRVKALASSSSIGAVVKTTRTRNWCNDPRKSLNSAIYSRSPAAQPLITLIGLFCQNKMILSPTFYKLVPFRFFCVRGTRKGLHFRAPTVEDRRAQGSAQVMGWYTKRQEQVLWNVVSITSFNMKIIIYNITGKLFVERGRTFWVVERGRRR